MTPASGRAAPHALSRRANRSRSESIIGAVLFTMAAITVVTTIAVVFVLAQETVQFFREVRVAEFFTERRWTPLFADAHYGIAPLVLGTLLVATIALAVGVPLGLGSAIFLSEYAKPGARKVLKPILEILASIPSVVLGFFALRFINPTLVRSWLEDANSSGNMIAAGIGVGILTIPLVASISEDALSAVPKALREASAGVGARKLTTTVSIVLPAAISGLVAAFIIATSRAIGETMVVFIAGGAADSALFAASPADQGLTMTAAMASVAAGTDEVAGSGNAFSALFFVGSILFFVTLVLNVIADRVVRRYRLVY